MEVAFNDGVGVEGKGRLTGGPGESAGFADECVSQCLDFLEDPKRGSRLVGRPVAVPSPHLKFSAEVMCDNRAGHVALVGGATTAWDIIKGSLTLEFGENALLLPTPFKETHRLWDRA